MLHSGKTQDIREQSILGFRQKRFQFLVATDVAARTPTALRLLPATVSQTCG